MDQLFAYPGLLQLIKTYQVIYLTKADKLRMTLSLLASRQSGNYESFSGEKVKLDPIAVKQQFGSADGVGAEMS